MSVLKVKDGNSWVSLPAGGVGVPSGGNAGEMLVKSSSADYATQWKLPLTMELLWTNPSPTSEFAAQTIPLDLSGYDLVAIEAKYRADSSSGALRTTTAIARQGYHAQMSIFSNFSASPNYVATRLGIVSSTGVAFESAYRKALTSTDAATASSSYIIPLRIYGIKGVIST